MKLTKATSTLKLAFSVVVFPFSLLTFFPSHTFQKFKSFRRLAVSNTYASYSQFMNDVERLVNNSRIFNGMNSSITKKAEDIKANLKRMLEHDRNTLGIDRCPLKNFEEVIRKKYAHIGRELPRWEPVVPFVPKVQPRQNDNRKGAKWGAAAAAAAAAAALQSGQPGSGAPIPEYIGVAAPSVPAWELSKKPSAGAKSVKASSATTTISTAAAAAATAAAASTEGAGSSIHMSVCAAAGAQPRGLVRNNSGAFSASASVVDLSRQADEDDASLLAMEQDVEDADETLGVTEFF